MNQTDGPAAPPPQSAADASDANRMVRADLVAAVFFIVLGAMILYGSWTMPRLEVRRIHPMTIPGLVPGLLSFALVVCGTLLALRSVRAKVEGGWSEFGKALVSEGALRALAVIAFVLVYTLGLVGWLPFWLATGIFIFAFIFSFEVWITPRPRPVVPSLAWALGLALVGTVVVTLVFERLFLVRLP